MITSSHNPKLQLARALLGRPKERREAGAFVAEGVRLVEEAFITRWPFRFVLYSSELSKRGQELVGKLKVGGVEIEEVAPHLLQSISETEASQGILAILELAPIPYPLSPNFILIPDQIRDPGNLGTLLRTAAAADVQAVLIPPETTDAFAPKVVRAGMGAHFRLPIISLAWEEIERFIDSASQRASESASQRVGESAQLKVFLADMEGQSCWEADFRRPLALIVGGEAEGASQEARKLASQQVRIPMPGGAESLNAASAGAILIFEIVRQRTETRSHP
ncbi:MAG: RNA methyltransferase [Anaerolineales bacterium]|nr:RNA methyltransferase [Anaerolineales bacterium]